MLAGSGQHSFFEIIFRDHRSPMQTLHTLDYSEAKRVLDLIVEKASAMQKAVVVAIADSHGGLICLARMDGAPVSSVRVATNKAYTAACERKPTKEIGEKVRHPEKGHDIAYYGDPNYGKNIVASPTVEA
jgi:glc operon protein GlcG